MKWLLIILLGVHGMIHLLGAAKGFQWAEIDALTQPVSRMRAWFWLLATVLFLIAMLALLANQVAWWLCSGTLRSLNTVDRFRFPISSFLSLQL